MNRAQKSFFVLYYFSPIMADIHRSQGTEMTLPQEYSLEKFLDLNWDGVSDVIVDIRRWEGDGAVIYQVGGQNITQVPCILWACDGLPDPGTLNIY